MREPDKYDRNGVAIVRGKSLPFCGLGCIFGYCGHKILRRSDPVAWREYRIQALIEKIFLGYGTHRDRAELKKLQGEQAVLCDRCRG